MSTKKQIIFFLSTVFILTMLITNILKDFLGYNTVIVIMFIPAIISLIAKVIFKDKSATFFIKLNMKKNRSIFMKTLILMPVFMYITAIINYFIFKTRIGLLSSVAIYSFQYTSLFEYLKGITYEVSNLAIIFPLYGIIQCLCEEFAWRGYLLPKLCKITSAEKAAILDGLFWGLWQLPVMSILYRDSVSNPIISSIMLIIASIAIGSIQSYLLYRTESIWCPLILSLSMNSISIYTPAAVFSGIAKGSASSCIFSGGAGIIAVLILSIYCYNKNKLVYVD